MKKREGSFCTDPPLTITTITKQSSAENSEESYACCFGFLSFEFQQKLDYGGHTLCRDG